MQAYLTLLYAVLLLATIIGFVRRPYMDLPLQKMFPFFLLFICFVQIVAIEYSRPLPHKSNHWIFNIYNPIECLFYSLLVLEGIGRPLLRKIGTGLCVVYGLFFLYNVSLLQGFWLFNHYTYVLGAFIIVCISLLFFIDTATSDNNLPILRNPLFWVASGLIIGMLGNFMILGLINYLIENKVTHVAFSRMVLKYCNSIMYSFFIVAFLCKQSKRKDSYL